MLNIIPFNDLFNQIDLEKIDFDTKTCFINNLSLIRKLEKTTFPIKNKRIAIKNVLEFLHYVDDLIERNDNKDTVIPISQKEIIRCFSDYTYYQFLQILSDLEVLTHVPYEDGTFYTKGSLFKRYRIHNKYLKQQELALVIVEENKKLTLTNSAMFLDNRFIDTIKNLEIDVTKAVLAEILYHQKNNTDLHELKTRVNRIFYTKKKRFIKQGNKVNRVYHSFSNISKISRQYLNIQFSNIDIVNCQPLLLVYHLKSNNLPIDDNYISDCEMGIFYERFIDKKNDREMVKRHLYKSIFFNFNKRINVNKKFKTLYPKTWASLEEIKLQSEQTGKTLAGLLQNIEAELFNNLIPKNSKHYFTLFDAIYFSDITDLYELENYIKDYFNKLNVKVTTKKEL